MKRKAISAALFVTVLGTLFLLTPLANVFRQQNRFLGVPAEMIYLFTCWLLLVLAALWLSRRLPHEAEAESDGDEA